MVAFSDVCPPSRKRRATDPPELQPKQLVAHRMNKGTEVLVKSLKNGRTWWRFSTGPLSSEPVIKGGFVYATGRDGTLWALHLKGDQRVAWTYRVDGSWGAEPTVLGDMLYIGDNNGTVHAIDAASGKCRWKTTVTSSDSRSRQLFSRAAVSDRRVYLGAVDGILYALDRTSGALDVAARLRRLDSVAAPLRRRDRVCRHTGWKGCCGKRRRRSCRNTLDRRYRPTSDLR